MVITWLARPARIFCRHCCCGGSVSSIIIVVCGSWCVFSSLVCLLSVLFFFFAFHSYCSTCCACITYIHVGSNPWSPATARLPLFGAGIFYGADEPSTCKPHPACSSVMGDQPWELPSVCSNRVAPANLRGSFTARTGPIFCSSTIAKEDSGQNPLWSVSRDEGTSG